MNEIIIAVIGFLGIFFTGLFGYLSSKKSKAAVNHAERELEIQSAALSFSDFVAGWDQVNLEIKHLFEETEIDRFLMLRAWNGEHDPRWTTAIFQMRKGDAKPISYIHYELDTDYQGRLRAIKQGALYFVTADEPPSSIKDTYIAEGVNATVWHSIATTPIPDSKAIAHTYVSFSTTMQNDISQATLAQCNRVAGMLKGLNADGRLVK